MAPKNVDHQTRKMFRPDQADLFEKSYEEELEEQRKQKVECLGMRDGSPGCDILDIFEGSLWTKRNPSCKIRILT